MRYVSKPRMVEGWHYEGECSFCGKKFQAKRSTAKYCSDTCRMMAHSARVTPVKQEKKVKEKKLKGDPIHFHSRAAMCRHHAGVKGFSIYNSRVGNLKNGDTLIVSNIEVRRINEREWETTS